MRVYILWLQQGANTPECRRSAFRSLWSSKCECYANSHQKGLLQHIELLMLICARWVYWLPDVTTLSIAGSFTFGCIQKGFRFFFNLIIGSFYYEKEPGWKIVVFILVMSFLPQWHPYHHYYCYHYFLSFLCAFNKPALPAICIHSNVHLRCD